MEPEKGRWLLVVFGIIINLCLGSIYAWSVFVKPLTKLFSDRGITLTATEAQLP
jgi:hypothetical protein